METISDIPSLKVVKTLWTALSGQVHAPPVVGSLMIYIMAFIICLLLQRICKQVLPKHLYPYAADFCITMLICSFPYGHGPMRRHYGHGAYLISAVTLVTVSLLLFEGMANPLSVFVQYLQGKESLKGLGLRVVLQVLAAFMSYRLVFGICLLELTKDQEQLLQGTCESHLKVPVLLGCLIEFSSVVYDTWLCHHQLFTNQLLDSIAKRTNGALLVCAGVHLTGMYMHPAMATGMTFYCKDTNILEHIAVYWLAAFLGTYISVKLSSVLSLPFPVKERKGADDAVVSSVGNEGWKTGSSNGVLKERLTGDKSPHALKSPQAEKSSLLERSPEAAKALLDGSRKLTRRQSKKN